MDNTGIRHREILFKGKRLDNGEWVEGHLLSFKAGQINPNRSFILPFASSVSVSLGAYTFGGFVEVDPATVGQYIGVTDKHRAKLYDGDIVKTKYGRVCLIIWHNRALCWDLVPVARLNCKTPDEGDLWWSDNLERIGNRWDNPELLVGEK